MLSRQEEPSNCSGIWADAGSLIIAWGFWGSLSTDTLTHREREEKLETGFNEPELKVACILSDHIRLSRIIHTSPSEEEAGKIWNSSVPRNRRKWVWRTTKQSLLHSPKWLETITTGPWGQWVHWHYPLSSVPSVCPLWTDGTTGHPQPSRSHHHHVPHTLGRLSSIIIHFKMDDHF